MKQETISEQNIRPEDMELGGNAAPFVDVRDMKEGQTFKYVVKDYRIVPTDWGDRVEYLVLDDYEEKWLSSWNFVTKQKFKVPDLIAKTVFLEKGKGNKPLLRWE